MTDKIDDARTSALISASQNEMRFFWASLRQGREMVERTRDTIRETTEALHDADQRRL